MLMMFLKGDDSNWWHLKQWNNWNRSSLISTFLFEIWLYFLFYFFFLFQQNWKVEVIKRGIPQQCSIFRTSLFFCIVVEYFRMFCYFLECSLFENKIILQNIDQKIQIPQHFIIFIQKRFLKNRFIKNNVFYK